MYAKNIVRLMALMLPCLFDSACAPAGMAGEIAAGESVPLVKIVLRAAAEVPSRDVTIADIADVEGGTEQLRDWIGQLDLSEPPRAGHTVRVTSQQVAFRIRLAGLDDRLFAVGGSRDVRVSPASYEVPESELIAVAENFVRQRLPWDSEDVVIQPAQASIMKIVVPALKSDVRLEANLRSQRTPFGRVRIDVSIWVNGRKQQEVPVLLDVRVYQLVALAKRRIERGQILSDDNIHFDRRPIEGMNDFLTAKDGPIGQRAKRSIPASQAVTAADIEPADLEKQALVKQGDVVKIVARAGGLRLSTTGEALQEGAAGKMIRVRNVDSKLVVTGRVLDRTTIEVLR
jgi:flagella basal body P-ring formation protein FlgA